jgi:hypothetical protein
MAILDALVLVAKYGASVFVTYVRPGLLRSVDES